MKTIVFECDIMTSYYKELEVTDEEFELLIESPNTLYYNEDEHKDSIDLVTKVLGSCIGDDRYITNIYVDDLDAE